MTADAYLQNILNREAVDTAPFSPVRGVQAVLYPVIAEWAGAMLIGVSPSGSFAKGTANKTGTDIDLFISLSEQTAQTLKEIYERLSARLTAKGYSPKAQNVSISVTVAGFKVDLVPAKRQGQFSLDHSLYRRKLDTWKQTNVDTHIGKVRSSGRTNEIRVLKLWRDQKGLEFPSFYLELTVINALSNQTMGTLPVNVLKVFEYLRDRFSGARVIDPANTNNIISDDLTIAEKSQVRAAAVKALAATNWNEIVV